MRRKASSLMSEVVSSSDDPNENRDQAADNGERRKVLVTDSTSTAFQRSFFHLVPIGTSIGLITINLRGVFVGFDFSGAIKSETINLMFLQLAAKANEILIVASLGLIVLQVVRHELLFGDGLPLGLVGSGLSFSDFSLFFRKEFYGSLRYVAIHGNKMRKVAFVALLILAGFTAALAGPSSAVLLVPRSQTWPSAATEVFLNGSSKDFWPDDLSGDLHDVSSLCSSAKATASAICPAGGFLSLQDHWSRMNSTTFLSQDIPSYSRQLSGSVFYWPVDSPASLIPPLYALGNPRTTPGLKDKTTLVQPLAAATVVLQQAATDWWRAMTEQKNKDREGMDALIDDRQVRSQSTSAIATVRCSKAQKLGASDKTVLFPSIPFWFDYDESMPLDVDNLSGAPSNHLHFQWIHLPGNFGPTSVGAIFQTPWSADNTTRVVIGCTAQTGWVPSEVRTDSYSFWSGWYPWNITFGARTPSYSEAPHDDSLTATNGRIALGDEWLGLLTPRAPTSSSFTEGWEPSTIESILANTALAQASVGEEDISELGPWSETDLPNQSRSSFLEAIICSILVDGISRTGSHRSFNKEGAVPKWHLNSYEPLPNFARLVLSGKNAFKVPDIPPEQFTTMRMTMSITGFALRRSLSAYLAMAVLLTHTTMATVNLIWTLTHKRTSRSWDSVSELIALAQNSTPAFGALANTAAGIECAATFARLAKIRVRSQPGSAQKDHVELVFEEDANNASVPRSRSRASSRRSLSFHHDPWPSVLPLGSNEVEDSRRSRGSLTWPIDPRKLSVVQQEDTEMHSRSTSTERLIPRVHLADEEKGDVVRVNRAYR